MGVHVCMRSLLRHPTHPGHSAAPPLPPSDRPPARPPLGLQVTFVKDLPPIKEETAAAYDLRYQTRAGARCLVLLVL